VTDVTVESDLELRLPPKYVPQESERISLYRRLDNMERPEQIEEFRAALADRFGAIPVVTDELIKVVPLRMAAKRLGIERIVLKGGVMRLYFVDDDNKAYYRSPAFGRVLGYLQANPRICTLRDIPARDSSQPPKHSLIVSGVKSVSDALAVLTAMCDTAAI